MHKPKIAQENKKVEIDNLYKELILEHNMQPKNKKTIENGNLSCNQKLYNSHQANSFCGDEIDLQVVISKEGIIQDLGWSGSGCSISQASVSIITQLVKGKTVEQALLLESLFKKMLQSKASNEYLTKNELEVLGDASFLEGVAQFPVRIKCALLGFSALKDSLSRYELESKNKRNHE